MTLVGRRVLEQETARAGAQAGLRWFAENKAIVWCLAITAASYLWARHLYNRRPVQ